VEYRTGRNWPGGRRGSGHYLTVDEDADHDPWDLKPLYRSLIRAYGWTYDEIDRRYMPELLDLVEDWKYNPPLVSLVEALVYGLSHTKKPRRLSKAESFDVNEFVRKTGGGVPNPDGTVAMFDLDEMRRRNAEALENRKQRRIAAAKEKLPSVRDSA
jgi:hypothetical protein